MNGKTILKGTVILTFSGIIVKTMGFFYRIYMSKLLGAEGMGLYQLIMPFYMLAYSFTSAGLTTAVSKVTSAEIGKNRIKSGFKAGIYACAIGAFLSFSVGLIGFIFSDFISGEILNAPAVSLAIKTLSISFPFMAAASCMRGVFYGLGKTEVPAASQIIEQSARMGVVFFIGRGLAEKGLEYACAAAALGMSAGEFLSFLFVLFIFIKGKKKADKCKCLDRGAIIEMLVSAAIPLTANRTVSSILSAVENMLIPRRLEAFGMTQSEALEIYGRVWGMVIPLVMFPSAFLMALSSVVMPVVSEKAAGGSKIIVKQITENTITIAIAIGMFASFLFFWFSDELGYIIYSEKNIGLYIKITALMCPLIYLQSAFSAILNGLSEQTFIFKNGLLSSCIIIGFVYFFIPLFEIKAFFLGWLISLGASTYFCISKIQKKVDIYIDIKGTAKCFISGFTAFMTAKILCCRIISIININAAVGISVIFAFIIYAVMLMYMGCIDFKLYKEAVRKK